MSTSNRPILIRTRDEAEAFLDDRIGHGVQPGLERIVGLLEFMGDPHDTYPSILIAGTNGKTTVSRMVQQILGAHGLATGGFTSPHLHRVEERFTLHGVILNEPDFIDAVAQIAWFVEAYEQQADTHITYFEVTTALAFSIFAAAAVDVAVIEVGLGGRLDATNVLDRAIAVITGIDIDHTEFLGTSVSEIAAEKAAIVARNGTLVTGPLSDEAASAVATRVEETDANWLRFGADFSVTDAVVAVGGHQISIEGVYSRYNDLYLPIHGRHQVDNLATAVAVSEMFLARELDSDALAIAVSSMTAPGRLEVVGHRPLTMVDGAHNAQGFRGLASTLENEFPAIGWQLVLGIRGERDVANLVAPLKGLVAAVHAPESRDSSAIDPEIVAADARRALDVEAFAVESVAAALSQAAEAAGPDGAVLVAGSLYLVGEAREAFTLRGDRTHEAHRRFEAPRFDDEGDEEDDEDDRDPDDGSFEMYGESDPLD